MSSEDYETRPKAQSRYTFIEDAEGNIPAYNSFTTD